MGRISTLKKCAQDDCNRLHRLSDSCVSIPNNVCWGFVRLYMRTFISPTPLWQELLLRNQYFTGVPDATSRTLRALPLNGFERSEWTACNNFSFQMQLWIDKENRFAYKSTSLKQPQILFLKKASPVFRSQHLNCP